MKLYSLAVSLVLLVVLAGTAGAQSPTASPPDPDVTITTLENSGGVVFSGTWDNHVLVATPTALSLNYTNVCRQCVAIYEREPSPVVTNAVYNYNTALYSTVSYSNAIGVIRKPPEPLVLEQSEKFEGPRFEWSETNEYGYEVLHQHDTSVILERWKCAAGHEAEFTRYGECWCGWRGGTVEPAKYIGEGSS